MISSIQSHCTSDGNWIAWDSATGESASGRTRAEAEAELRRRREAKRRAA